MIKLAESISNIMVSSCAFAARIMLGFIAAIMFLQVVLRYVFNAALPWPEEASRYAMIWVVLLIGNVLVRDEELITVDFLDRMWPSWVKKYRDSIYRILILVLLAVLVKEGFTQAIHGWNRTTTALGIRWFWPYICIPIGAGFMMFQMVFLIFKDVISIIYRQKGDLN
jgi:TRAP-type C4-dicarboxylate transport system permease small subunit